MIDFLFNLALALIGFAVVARIERRPDRNY